MAEAQFLRINVPPEPPLFGKNPAFAVSGGLLLPEGKDDSKNVEVRVRLYRPVNGKLVVEREGTAKIRPDRTRKGLYLFVLNWGGKGKVCPPGQYIVRVDCLDKSVKGTPLVATSSVFITIAADEKQELTGVQLSSQLIASDTAASKK